MTPLSVYHIPCLCGALTVSHSRTATCGECGRELQVQTMAEAQAAIEQRPTATSGPPPPAGHKADPSMTSVSPEIRIAIGELLGLIELALSSEHEAVNTFGQLAALRIARLIDGAAQIRPATSEELAGWYRVSQLLARSLDTEAQTGASQPGAGPEAKNNVRTAGGDRS